MRWGVDRNGSHFYGVIPWKNESPREYFIYYFAYQVLLIAPIGVQL